MDSRGGNPFLMDENSTPTIQQVSNPFLQDFVDPEPAVSVGENPFLNFSVDQPVQQSLDSTNPFAFFTTDVNKTDVNTNVLDTQIDLTSVENFQDEKMQSPDMFSSELGDPEVPVKITYTETVRSRPPPPKPVPPPPPRNTKDLILSVTGAMDATSSQMLDRLQNTRTPSPTLMHSPSPTPEHSVADLLDVDSNVPDISDDLTKVVETSEGHDVLDIFDATNSQTTLAITTERVMSSTDPFTISEIQDNIFSGMQNDSLIAGPDILENAEPDPQNIVSQSCSMGSADLYGGKNFY